MIRILVAHGWMDLWTCQDIRGSGGLVPIYSSALDDKFRAGYSGFAPGFGQFQVGRAHMVCSPLFVGCGSYMGLNRLYGLIELGHEGTVVTLQII